jgi:hypothetical protein
MTHRPSLAATPSRALSNPLRLRLLASFESSGRVEILRRDDPLALVSTGVPVEDASRVTERVNAASRSSRRRIHLAARAVRVRKHRLYAEHIPARYPAHEVHEHIVVHPVERACYLCEGRPVARNIDENGHAPLHAQTNDVNVQAELTRQCMYETRFARPGHAVQKITAAVRNTAFSIPLFIQSLFSRPYS